MKVRVIDFETTEDDVKADHIVEFGYTDFLVDEMAVSNPVSGLINPGRPIAPQSSAVHHITTSMVLGAPLVQCVPNFLLDGMEPGDVFAAHNAEYERRFFDGHGHAWICTRKVAHDLYEDAPSYALQTLRYWLDLDRAGMSRDLAFPPHRGGPDSYMTAWLLAVMHRAMSNVEYMVALSDRPMLLRSVPFPHAHKGKSFEEIDDGLLRWYLGLDDLSEDLRFTVEYHLEKRRQERGDPFRD